MIPVTKRATPAARGRLHTVDAAGAAFVRHGLQFPIGACPVSRNPTGGTVAILYRPRGVALEVVSLLEALAWACSNAEGAPQSVESVAAWLALECRAALGVRVRVVVDLTVNPGAQRLAVTAVA